MGLKATIENALKGGWNAVGDLKTSVTITLPGTAVYDPATGSQTSVDVSAECSVVLTSIKSPPDDNKLPKADMIALVRGSDLSFVPRKGCLVSYSGYQYVVELAVSAPGDVVWELYLVRSTGG